MTTEKEYLKEEIRKEFQLERMVLFSDAVFAIAITLMAIEIKAPDVTQLEEPEVFLNHLKPVLPVMMAYVVSFFFIGYTWYQHLQLFSLRRAPNKLKYLAGSESAMGAFVNDVLPEDAARRLREAGAS